jgi:hypothetical protein
MTKKERVQYLLARPIDDLTPDEARELGALTLNDLVKADVLVPVGRTAYERLLNGIRVR